MIHLTFDSASTSLRSACAAYRKDHTIHPLFVPYFNLPPSPRSLGCASRFNLVSTHTNGTLEGFVKHLAEGAVGVNHHATLLDGGAGGTCTAGRSGINRDLFSSQVAAVAICEKVNWKSL